MILFVRDNGVGIAPAMIPQIFNMFTQVESTGDSSEGGLGIGLALVKGLVQLHGGRIVGSSLGIAQGSEFIVFLPPSLVIETPSATSDAFNGHSNVNPRRVLIADDNHDGGESLAMLLNLCGHEVFLARSGEEALNVAKQQQPDVAVLDIGMPDLSGYEVAQRIRLEPWGKQITLIALTGWGQENDRLRARAAGFDHHCTKPVDPDDLQRFFAPQVPTDPS